MSGGVLDEAGAGIEVNSSDEISNVLSSDIASSSLAILTRALAFIFTTCVTLADRLTDVLVCLGSYFSCVREFAIAVRFQCDIFNHINPAVDEFLLREQTLEDDFSVLEIEAVQVLSLYLFLIRNLDPVHHSKLRHVKQALQPVELAVLDRIHTEIHLRQQRQVLNVLQLVDLSDIVQTHVQKFQAINLLKASQLRNVVLGQVQGPEHRQRFKFDDLAEVVGANEQFLEPQVFQVFDFANLVAVEAEDSQALVGREPIDFLNLIVVQIQVLQVGVRLGACDASDSVA